jgi:hypothetical protein
LNGKRIGVYQWGIIALVWIVGVLAEEHGLDIASVDWVAETESRFLCGCPEAPAFVTRKRDKR